METTFNTSNLTNTLRNLIVEWQVPEIFIAGPSRTGYLTVKTPQEDSSLFDLLILELIDSNKGTEIREAFYRIQKLRGTKESGENGSTLHIRFSLCSKTKWQMEYNTNNFFHLRFRHPKYQTYNTSTFRIVARHPRKKRSNSNSDTVEEIKSNKSDKEDQSEEDIQNSSKNFLNSNQISHSSLTSNSQELIPTTQISIEPRNTISIEVNSKTKRKSETSITNSESPDSKKFKKK